MKNVLRGTALVLAALLGFLAVIHGVVEIAWLRYHPAENPDFTRHLIIGGIALAGGVCVLSLAVQLLWCWHTHKKGGGLL
jgi:uncharacterized membrane protein HdeD (DUF308 family)